MAKKRMRHAAALTAACGLAATGANAQNTWTDASGGDYGDASNWSGGAPTSTDDLLFDLDAAYTVTLSTFGVAGSITVGESDLTIDLNANSLIFFGADPLRLPSPARGTSADTGSLTFQNGSVLFAAATPMTISGRTSDGSSFSQADLSAVDTLLDFSGDLHLDGAWIDLQGAGSSLDAGALTFGGASRLTMAGGAVATVASLTTNGFPSTASDHRIELDGAGTTLSIGGDLHWAAAHPAATPSIVVQNGARLEAAGAAELYGSAGPSPTNNEFDLGPDLVNTGGAVSVGGALLLHGAWVEARGAGATFDAGAVTLRDSARFVVASGAVATVASLRNEVFTTVPGSHEVEVDGAGTRLDIAGALDLRSSANGIGFASLAVTNGAQVTADTLRLAAPEFSYIGFLVSGPDSRIDITGVADISTFQSASPSARPTIEDGAVLSADQIRTSGHGLIVRGASSRVEAATRIDMGGRLSLVDGATAAAPIVGISTLGGDNDAGLSGHGTVDGNVLVGNAATFGTSISPGAGGLTITGDFESVAFDGAPSPIVYLDLNLAQSSAFLTIGGTADLTGFDLQVVGGASASIGQTITLIDAGTVVGAFDTASLPSVPELRSDLSWSLVYTANSVELTLVPTPGALTVAPLLGLAALRRRR